MKDTNNKWQNLERWGWKVPEKFSLVVVFEVEVLLFLFLF